MRSGEHLPESLPLNRLPNTNPQPDQHHNKRHVARKPEIHHKWLDIAEPVKTPALPNIGGENEPRRGATQEVELLAQAALGLSRISSGTQKKIAVSTAMLENRDQ